MMIVGTAKKKGPELVPPSPSSRQAWPGIDELVTVVRDFIDPVLVGDSGAWNPKSWTWQRR
jgi:hypothetical protein